MIGAAVVAAGLAIAGTAQLSRQHATANSNVTGTTSAASQTSALQDQAFLAHVSDVCAPYAQAEQALVFPYPRFDPLHPTVQLLPGVANFEREHYGNDRLLTSLRTLQPPTDDKTAWAQLLDLIAQQIRLVQAQITAAADSNPAAFTATADTLHGLIPHLDTALHRVGLPEANACATTLED